MKYREHKFINLQINYYKIDNSSWSKQNGKEIIIKCLFVFFHKFDSHSKCDGVPLHQTWRLFDKILINDPPVDMCLYYKNDISYSSKIYRSVIIQPKCDLSSCRSEKKRNESDKEADAMMVDNIRILCNAGKMIVKWIMCVLVSDWQIHSFILGNACLPHFVELEKGKKMDPHFDKMHQMGTIKCKRI